MGPRLTIEFVSGENEREKFQETAKESGLKVVVREEDVTVIKFENMSSKHG